MVISGRYASIRPAAVIALLLALAVIVRVAFLYGHLSDHAEGEAYFATASLAATGTLSNPFSGESGPTAHLLPIPLLIGAAVYRLLGIGTRPAELVLSAWSITLALGGFTLMLAVFRRAGASAAACLIGLALCCCLPVNLGLEAITFREWEGGLAVTSGAAVLLAVVTLDRSGRSPSTRTTVALALAAAFVFLVSPQVGLAAYAVIAWLFVRRVPARRWAGAIGIAVVALALVLGPWLWRNERVFGTPLLRSNFGLELAIGFHPAAVDPPDARQAYIDRMLEVQPLATPRGFAKMKAAGGEVAYAKRLGAQTEAWMATHPGDTLLLGARHLRQYLFPPVWSFMGQNPSADRATVLKFLLVTGLTILGLLGLSRRLMLAPFSAFTFVAIGVAVTALPFALVQPILRYRYLIFVPLTFYAADFAVWSLTLHPATRRLVERVERWWVVGSGAEPTANPAP